MNTTPQTISVTELRSKTREVIRRAVETKEPVYILYNSQMPVCLVSTETLQKYSLTQQAQKKSLRSYAGFLKNSKAFSGSAVAYQRKLRAEWPS